MRLPCPTNLIDPVSRLSMPLDSTCDALFQEVIRRNTYESGDLTIRVERALTTIQKALRLIRSRDVVYESMAEST